MSKVFVELFKALKLSREKCPWAKEQVLEDQVKELLSEARELRDAVRRKDFDAVCEELGDVFWDSFFIAIIAEEKGYFSLDDSLAKALAKLRRRKPWLFNGTSVESKEAAMRLWFEAKQRERANTIK